MSPKVLFVGHAASRSGAPILLLQFMAWVKRNTELTFDAMVVNGGPLLADMRAVAPTTVLDTPPSLAERTARKLIGRERWSERSDRLFQRAVAKRGYDVAYVNTIVPEREIRLLSQLGLPVICHVHELEFATLQMVGEAAMRRLIPGVTEFVAASQAVGDYLRERWQIPESKVRVIHTFTSAAEPLENSETRQRTRTTLGVGDHEILVGGCGTLDWRKGADLFLHMARLTSVSRGGPSLKFVWVGADLSHPDTKRFLHDVKASGLTESIKLVETTPEPGRYFQAMDIFALTSREDPFPIVMLEAAAIAKPLVCFAGSGGGPEFVENDAGLVAPYLDVEAFSQHVLTLAADPQQRRALGSAGRQKVHDRYTITVQAPRLVEVITRLANRD